jgi:hypothetical protein
MHAGLVGFVGFVFFFFLVIVCSIKLKVNLTFDYLCICMVCRYVLYIG